MKKLLPLLVLAGVGASQYETIAEFIEVGADSARETAAMVELRGIATVVTEQDALDALPYGVERNFVTFLRRHMTRPNGGDVGLDAWGNPYFLHLEPSFFEVSSAGPDGLHNTEDDVWLEVPRN